MRMILAYGIPGYGPDASDDNYSVCETWPQVAAVARRMLAESADGLGDGAEVAAQQGDYETAWKTRARADEMYNLHDTLSNERANAPLYAGKPELWDAEIERIIGESFPYDVDPGCRIYVWESSEFGLDECARCGTMADFTISETLCDACADPVARLAASAIAASVAGERERKLIVSVADEHGTVLRSEQVEVEPSGSDDTDASQAISDLAWVINNIE